MQELAAADLDDGRPGVLAGATAAERDLLLGVGELALELLALLDQRLEALDEILGARLQQRRRILDALSASLR